MTNVKENNLRLENLKEEKYLTMRVFVGVSENMHYEIFKYLSWIDLLQIKATKLGGYQLISNKILRSRIKSYIKGIINYPTLEEDESELFYRSLYDQSENNKLTIKGILYIYIYILC